MTFKKLSEILNKQEWEKKFEGKDAQFYYSEFLNVYNKGFEKFIAKINIDNNLKKKPKWLTRGMNSNMRKRLNLWCANKRFKWRDTS